MYVRLLGKVGQFLGRHGESGTVNKYTLEIVSFDILKYSISQVKVGDFFGMIGQLWGKWDS